MYLGVQSTRVRGDVRMGLQQAVSAAKEARLKEGSRIVSTHDAGMLHTN
jgi:hypothetical protein